LYIRVAEISDSSHTNKAVNWPTVKEEFLLSPIFVADDYDGPQD
jgi:hypothetical protein